MKLKLALLMLCAVASLTANLSASPIACPPNFDSRLLKIDPVCADIGAQIYAVPGSLQIGSFEDIAAVNQSGNRNYGDVINYGDMVWTMQFNADGTQATVTYLGSSAVYLDKLMLNGQVLFVNVGWGYANFPGDTVVVNTTPGAAVPFELSWQWYYNGVWDMGTVQDWAACVSGCEGKPPEPSQVPEPGTGVQTLIGVLTVLALFGISGFAGKGRK